MQRRLFLLFLSILPYASQSEGNSAAWNCEQSKDGKEWVCNGDAKAAETVSAPISEKPISDKIEKAAPVETANPEPITPPIEKAVVEKEITRPIPVATKIESSSRLGIFPAAFDDTQEQTFNVLKSQLKVDPWEHCSNPNAPKYAAQIRSNKSDRDHSPIDIKSNYSEIFDNEISSFSGNVEVKHADQRLFANKANYDSVTKTLDSQGDVYLSEDDMSVHTEAVMVNSTKNQIKSSKGNVLFIYPNAPFRGHSDSINKDGKITTLSGDVAVTSCPTGSQDWVIHAPEAQINEDEGRLVAHNAWLEFKGTPFLYTPYLSLPIDKRRTSGFLAPSFGSTQRSGFNISTPYYFNIAENYDATFRPRYLTKRGILLAGEGRYLTESSRGQANLEVLPNDYLRDNQPRYFASFKDTTKFTDKIQANVDFNFVSDKNYFAELGSALSMPNFSYLKSQADVGYYGDNINAVARVENYQSIDQSLKNDKLPYRKLPQVNVNLKHSFEQLPVPINVGMENEFVYFQHTSLQNGQRSNLKPFVSIPLQSASAYITPKIALQYTNYFLSNPLNAGDSTQIDRTLPIFSTDSGMTFERNVNLGGKGFLNTIEPRLFYLYIPRKNQDNIQIFDTAVYDTWFNTLFRENRFSGIDRMQDANQFTTAITSRLIDETTGKERMKFSLGNTFYLQDRNVQARYSVFKYMKDGSGHSEFDRNGIIPLAEINSFSNIIGELSSRINDHVAVDSGLQWNPHAADIDRGKFFLHLTGNTASEILNLGYRYRRDVMPKISQADSNNPDIDWDTTKQNLSTGISQTDVSFSYPIYDNWSAIGRWQYSLLYNSTQESFFGIEKENCCWRFRVVGRRYVNNLNVFDNGADVQGTSQTGVFFQVELKGLTGMGEKLDTFLEQNIYGYRSAQ